MCTEVGQNHFCDFFGVRLGIRVVKLSRVLNEAVFISKERNNSKWNELWSVFLCLQKHFLF